MGEFISRHRLSKEEIAEACVLYEEKGWKILWIARKFNIDHTSILYLIRKRALTRKIPVLDSRPDEVASMYRRRLREERELRGEFDDEEDEEYSDFYTNEEDSHVKSYSTIVKEATQRRSHTQDNECSHPFWIQRCSMCKAVLSSDSQVNTLPSTDVIRTIYNDVDKIVCTYNTALDLQTLGVKQQSMFYWIFYEDRNALTIRIKTNLPEKTDENALIASAFTSQELFKHLLKVKPSLKTVSFMRKLALNGDNPTYLGKLLCRCLRKVERSKVRRTPPLQQLVVTQTNESSI